MEQRPRRRAFPRVVATLTAALAGIALACAAPVATSAAAAPSAAADDTELQLVTLRGPGVAGYLGPLSAGQYRQVLLQTQDAALARVGAEPPVYRWTTALNGFAAELTAEQATALRADLGVALVEENSVRPLAGRAALPGRGLSSPVTSGRARGGAGQVIGLVDSGIWPESPLFAATPNLGREPRRFRGGCVDTADWAADACNDKLVGARWFVHGFGTDRLRSSSSLSPRDDHGHGTQMASIAAGDAGVSIEIPGQRLGTYGGVAPQARVAAYKACWTAPDPTDDGCATADLVSAIDRATRDRVDVLNLSVGGPTGFDTVERALLGAVERGIVVVAAAGNDPRNHYAAHASPWVTTVGATTGDVRQGEVVLPDGTTFTGAMAAGRGVEDVRLVLGEDVAAQGVLPDEARVCRPGSLDAARTAGRIVVCDRGGDLARVAKSAGVRRADGIGMVLVNDRRGSVVADLHSVPTVHLDRADGAALRTWAEAHPHGRTTLEPLGVQAEDPRVASWSAAGDADATTPKPDLVAPGSGLLGSVPPLVREERWDFATGTSAASAWTSGLALRLLADTGWSADAVRSALVTSAVSAAGRSGVLDQGAGRPRFAAAEASSLAFLVKRGTYRSWLDGLLDIPDLNTPSIQLTDDRDTATRTVTSTADDTVAWTAELTGFESHQVGINPSSFVLAPGDRARFTFRVAPHAGVRPVDDGWILWHGSDGSVVRVPVVLSR